MPKPLHLPLNQGWQAELWSSQVEVLGGRSPLKSRQAVNLPYLLTSVHLLAAQPHVQAQIDPLAIHCCECCLFSQ